MIDIAERLCSDCELELVNVSPVRLVRSGCGVLTSYYRSSDPVKKQSLKQLHDMWIALANESAHMSRRELDREVACIEAIQAGIDPRHQFGHYPSGDG